YDLTANDDYRRAGEAALESFMGAALSNPYGCAHLLTVAERTARGYVTVAIAAAREDAAGARELEDAAVGAPLPHATVYRVPEADWAPEALSGKVSIDGRSAAYVCRAHTCSPPVTKPADLVALMQAEA